MPDVPVSVINLLLVDTTQDPKKSEKTAYLEPRTSPLLRAQRYTHSLRGRGTCESGGTIGTHACKGGAVISAEESHRLAQVGYPRTPTGRHLCTPRI